jgi:hypothetical protein
MPERYWQPTGRMEKITTEQQVRADDLFERKILQAVERKEHLWIVIVTYVASETTLNAMSDPKESTPILDHENLAMQPYIGCYVCEEPFEPRIRNYKCKGDPNK